MVVFSTSQLEAFESTNYFPLWPPAFQNERMPLPMGLGLTYYFQDQNYKLAEIDIDTSLFDPSMIDDQVSIENLTTEMNVKFDVWVLPFVNIFGLIGKVKGETNVELGSLYSDLDIKYDGLVYGTGANIALGWRSMFISLNTTYTETNLNDRESAVEAWIISPKAGLNLVGLGVIRELAIWSGAMYQEYDEFHRGHILIEGIGNVNYKVTLKQEDSWNYLAGFSAAFSRHWHLETEAGFGPRNQLVTSLTYRF